MKTYTVEYSYGTPDTIQADGFGYYSNKQVFFYVTENDERRDIAVFYDVISVTEAGYSAKIKEPDINVEFDCCESKDDDQ